MASKGTPTRHAHTAQSLVARQGQTDVHQANTQRLPMPPLQCVSHTTPKLRFGLVFNTMRANVSATDLIQQHPTNHSHTYAHLLIMSTFVYER